MIRVLTCMLIGLFAITLAGCEMGAHVDEPRDRDRDRVVAPERDPALEAEMEID